MPHPHEIWAALPARLVTVTPTGASRTESQLLLVKLFMHVVRNLRNIVMTRRQLVHRSRQARLRPEAPKRARGQCPTLTKFGLPCRLAS